MRTASVGVLLIFALSGCRTPSSSTPPLDSSAGDRTVTLRPGESVTQDGARLEYRGIVRDLRCHAPPEATCVVDGPVVVAFERDGSTVVRLGLLARGPNRELVINPPDRSGSQPWRPTRRCPRVGRAHLDLLSVGRESADGVTISLTRQCPKRTPVD